MTSKHDDKHSQNLYALILAGGVGTRLWPRSRKKTPKQLLNIASEKTMLVETFARIESIIPVERTLVATNDIYAPLIKTQVPTLPLENIIIEPSGKGTAPCIGLSALHLRRWNPDSIMASLNSDHVILDAEGFCRALQAAAEMASRGHLVTLGIQPDSPHTGYGYIQQGEPLDTINDYPIFRVEKFKEKPNLETAKKFLQDGDHLWNSGIFIWNTSALMDALQRHIPDLYAQLQIIDGAIGTEEETSVLVEVWEQIQNVSIDIGVLEKADNVVVIPLQVGWNDVGSWAQLPDILPADSANNVIVAQNHIELDTSDSLIYTGSDRLVATIDLHDMIIVDADDVLLVCPKDRAQDVKKLIDELKRQGKEQFL